MTLEEAQRRYPECASRTWSPGPELEAVMRHFRALMDEFIGAVRDRWPRSSGPCWCPPRGLRRAMRDRQPPVFWAGRPGASRRARPRGDRAGLPAHRRLRRRSLPALGQGEPRGYASGRRGRYCRASATCSAPGDVLAVQVGDGAGQLEHAVVGPSPERPSRVVAWRISCSRRRRCGRSDARRRGLCGRC